MQSNLSKPSISLRVLARQADAQKYEKLARLHRHALVLLRSDRRQDVIAKAQARIQKWEEQDLCSRFYIDAWKRLLNSDPSHMEQEVCNGAPQAHALAQNSPFSFLMKEVQ